MDRTVPPLDKPALKAEGLFPAVLMSVADAQRQAIADQETVLQDAFMQAKLVPPSFAPGAVDGLLDQAEDLVLDLLVREV